MSPTKYKQFNVYKKLQNLMYKFRCTYAHLLIKHKKIEHTREVRQIVSICLQQVQYICTKLRRQGLGCILYQRPIDHNHPCSLPQCLSIRFEEAEATHCKPSLNCSLIVPHCCFPLFHVKKKKKKQPICAMSNFYISSNNIQKIENDKPLVTMFVGLKGSFLCKR